MKNLINILIALVIAFSVVSCEKKDIKPEPNNPTNPIDSTNVEEPKDTTVVVINSIFGNGLNGTIDTTKNLFLDTFDGNLGVDMYTLGYAIEGIFPNLFSGKFTANNTTTQVTKNGIILDNTKQNQLITYDVISKSEIEFKIKSIDLPNDNREYSNDMLQLFVNQDPFDRFTYNDGNPLFRFDGINDFASVSFEETRLYLPYNYTSDNVRYTIKTDIKFLTANKLYIVTSFRIDGNNYVLRTVVTK